MRDRLGSPQPGTCKCRRVPGRAKLHPWGRRGKEKQATREQVKTEVERERGRRGFRRRIQISFPSVFRQESPRARQEPSWLQDPRTCREGHVARRSASAPAQRGVARE